MTTLEVTDRQAFLINLLAKGFLGTTIYEPKRIDVVLDELADLIGETQDAADRFETTRPTRMRFVSQNGGGTEDA